ncbi:MAG TPA: GspH/FimT family pseudopilin [Tepidisphaeraceae bacterium]|jgi:MSHA pilin protein MshC
MNSIFRLFPASPRPRVPACSSRVSPSSSRRGGFTLIEILTVVVVIGIASAVILPQMSSRDDQRVASASRELMADLLYAQNRAIAYQTRHYVQFNTQTNSWQVMTDASSAPGAIITHPVNGTPYVIKVGTGTMAKVTLNSVSFDGNTTISFDPLGMPFSWSASGGNVPLASGAVVFKAGTYQMTVNVAPYSGEITTH